MCPNLHCKFLFQGLPFNLCFFSKSQFIEFWLEYWVPTMRNYNLYSTSNRSVRTGSSSLWKLPCALVRRVVTFSFPILPFFYQFTFVPHTNKICKSTAIQGTLHQNIFDAGVEQQWNNDLERSGSAPGRERLSRAMLYQCCHLLPFFGIAGPENAWTNGQILKDKPKTPPSRPWSRQMTLTFFFS